MALEFDWSAFAPFVEFEWQDGKTYKVRRIDAVSINEYEAALSELPEDADDMAKLNALVAYLVNESGCPCAVGDMPAIFRNALVAEMGGSSLGKS